MSNRIWQMVILCSITIALNAQQITPQLKGPNQEAFFKTLPLLNQDTPEWVIKMYSDNPNVWEVDRLYNIYYRSNDFVKTTHTQNYKFWRKLLQENHWINTKGYIQTPTITEFRNQQARIAELQKASSTTQRSTTWTSIGPLDTKALENEPEVSWQTNVYTLDQSISNPNVVYCGSETGALFKSTDKGANWTNIGAFISDGAPQGIGVDPTNENIVFFGMRNNIYRSLDGGTTITSVYTQSNLNAKDFYINPSNNQIILAATQQGLLRSSDGGTTWTSISSEQSWDLEARPGTPNTVYALISKPSDLMIKFYRSTDAGLTFTEEDTGWFAGSINGIDNTTRGARMAVTPADPDRIYVALLGIDVDYDTDNNWLGVYVSRNGGDTWSLPVGEVGGPYSSSHFCLSSFNPTSTGYDQGYYNLGIAASAKNADSLLVGCLNLFSSGDAAASYTQWGGYGGGPGWQHPDIQEIEINRDDVWVASDGGINLYTSDWQSHIARNNGINGSSYWGFDSGWNKDVLVGGRYHNGNGGFVESYPDGKFLRLGGAESPTGIVNKGENLKVWHSDIGGDLLPETITDPVTNIGNLALYPNESYFNENKSDLKTYPYCYNHLLLGKDNILWKSEDGGGTFYDLFTFGNSADPLANIEISRSNPDVIYVVQKISGSTLLWRTTDGGINWTSTTVPGAVGGGMFITLSPNDENTIWAAHSKNGNSNKVLKSTDGGQTWTDLTTATINGLWPEDILVQGGTNGGVYLSTNLAMYYRNDTHSDWQLYNTGLPANFGVVEMRPFYRDSKLRAASNRGIWEVDYFESFSPIAQPTVDKVLSTCPLDTFQFEDFSMIDHLGASWTWIFTPNPIYVESTSIRNPKVVFGTTGSFSASLTVTNPNGTSSKSLDIPIEIVGTECLIDTIPGGAMQCFSSGDWVQTPDLDMDGVTEMTITAWVKPTGIQPEYTGIVMNDGNTAGFNFREGNNTLAYHWPGGAWWWDSNLIVPADEWSHVAMVATPTSLTVYVNGVGATHNTNLDPVDITTMKIGSYKGWGSRNYNGLIDEVAIWNRALTQEEIREHRHLTHYLDNDPTIQHYYQFNESINTIYDKIQAKHANFNGNAIRVSSTAPVGGGTEERLSVNTEGNYVFGQTGIEIDFSSGTLPDGELVGFQLNVPPDEVPGTPTIPNAGYYIINNYGNNAVFSPLNSLKLGNTNVLPIEATNPSSLKLYKRPSNADGATWGASIASASAATESVIANGNVEFGTDNGIISFSQFIIQQEICPDTLYVNINPIDGDTLRASLLVSSNGTQETGTNISFFAGNCVDLGAGFTVESGAEFLAAIENCIATTTLVETNNSANEKDATLWNDMPVKISSKKDAYHLLFELKETGKYSIAFQSITGRHQLHPLQNQVKSKGQHQLMVAKDQIINGYYYLMIEKDGQVVARKLILME